MSLVRKVNFSCSFPSEMPFISINYQFLPVYYFLLWVLPQTCIAALFGCGKSGQPCMAPGARGVFSHLQVILTVASGQGAVQF